MARDLRFPSRWLAQRAPGFFCLWMIAMLALESSAISAARASDLTVDRILIVYQDGSTFISAIEIAQGLSDGLSDLPNTKLEVYTEFLDSVRFSAPEHIGKLADAMVAKYEPIPLNVIVTIGPEALRFVLDHRRRIAPKASVVFGDMSERSLKRLAPPEDMKGVITAYDVSKTIDLAIRLQPDAERIVVVSGSAEFDRYWQESARQKLGAKYRDLPVEYLSDLALDALVVETQKLSAQTILLILTVFEDASGRKYRPRDATATIAASSSAPSYGVLSSYVGSGIIGGDLATYQSIGEDIAASVARTLSGDGSAPRIVYATNQPVVDWRQLQRWGIDRSLLPDDVNLLYYTPSLWEQYRWQSVSVALALLAQTLAILGLFYEHRRRAAAEGQARARLLEVVHLNQSATAGALSASIAHELAQPLGAIRVNAEAADMILSSEKPNLDLVHQILADIRDDDQRAGDIIVRLRGLLKRRSEIEWQEFDLNDVIKSAIQILHAEAERRSVVVSSSRTELELPIRADQVHVQQVILNLATNAMDAMLEAGSTERKLSFHTKVTEASKVELSISDTGRGIPSDKLASVFDAFYTTKPSGTGLGLSIARAIVETYGGKIWADNRPEGGAVFRFVLPLAQRG